MGKGWPQARDQRSAKAKARDSFLDESFSSNGRSFAAYSDTAGAFDVNNLAANDQAPIDLDSIGFVTEGEFARFIKHMSTFRKLGGF